MEMSGAGNTGQASIVKGHDLMTSPSTIEYRTIDRYPGYLIGSEGTIVSRHGRPLAGYIDKDGYHRVSLAVERGKGAYREKRGIHQLVCEAFHGPKPSPFHVVRHLDGIESHNEYLNLCWGTLKENSDDRLKHGTKTFGTRSGTAKLTDDDIPQIRLLIQEGMPQRTIATRFGVSQRAISCVNKGHTWSHIGDTND